MIPGNIDLTENLDFRKTVRKETPQLPATWNGNKKKPKNKLSITNGNTLYLNSTYIDTISTTYYYDNITYDWFDLNTYVEPIIEDDGDLIISTGPSSYTASYSISNTTWTISSNNTNITSNNHVKLISSEPEYDVFGNKKRKPKEIPAIPWSRKTYGGYSRNIPWGRQRDLSLYRRYYDNRIPWEPYMEEWDRLRMDNENKPRLCIAWLKNKSLSFIREYFEPDHDSDLNYLTNMSWIRVKDAVID